MKDAIAIENKQICWDNAMDSGLKYAIKWLDGGTGVMLKAQSPSVAEFYDETANRNIKKNMQLETIPLGVLIHHSMFYIYHDLIFCVAYIPYLKTLDVPTL